MKRTLPIITVLISLSLLGLIFFQFLWIKSARDAKNKQVEENIISSMKNVSERLTASSGTVIPLPQQRNDILFPGENRMQMQPFRLSVMQRFSKEEIAEVIRLEFNRNNLKHYPFEFAIIENSITGKQLLSDNFYKFFQDSSNNKNYVYPLIPPSGSDYENLVNEELLTVIVPNQEKIIWREMLWFIIGAILFTLIITTAFFITLRTLLKQKKLSEIKSDFINNMTHEFKTRWLPFHWQWMRSKTKKCRRILRRPLISPISSRKKNKRMNKQVETILQAALLDKQEVQLNLKKLSAHDMITSS
ncbi:MAG: hypothetical protein U0V75_09855 [Ferruginibacter sp.]